MGVNGGTMDSKAIISPGRTHGKAATYIAGCRCSPCRAAHAERILRQQHRRAITVGKDTGSFKHGRSGYVNHRCRCEVCSASASEACRAYQAKVAAIIQSGYRPEPGENQAG